MKQKTKHITSEKVTLTLVTLFSSNRNGKKFTSRFNKIPYIVIYRKGTQLVAENKQKHRVKRNVSHFKKCENTEECSDEAESELYEDNNGNYNNEPEHESEQAEQSEQEEQAEQSEKMFNRWPKPARRPPVRYGHPIPSSVIP